MFCLGIDIGGTNIKIKIFKILSLENYELKEIASEQIPTPIGSHKSTNFQTERNHLTQEISQSILRLSKAISDFQLKEVVSIGIAIPGTPSYQVDYNNPSIQSCPNIDYLVGYDLDGFRQGLTQILPHLNNTEFSLYNDAICFGFAEIKTGSLKSAQISRAQYIKEMQNKTVISAVITVGTAIGCSIILDKNIISNKFSSVEEVPVFIPKTHMNNFPIDGIDIESDFIPFASILINKVRTILKYQIFKDYLSSEELKLIPPWLKHPPSKIQPYYLSVPGWVASEFQNKQSIMSFNGIKFFEYLKKEKAEKLDPFFKPILDDFIFYLAKGLKDLAIKHSLNIISIGGEIFSTEDSLLFEPLKSAIGSEIILVKSAELSGAKGAALLGLERILEKRIWEKRIEFQKKCSRLAKDRFGNYNQLKDLVDKALSENDWEELFEGMYQELSKYESSLEKYCSLFESKRLTPADFDKTDIFLAYFHRENCQQKLIEYNEKMHIISDTSQGLAGTLDFKPAKTPITIKDNKFTVYSDVCIEDLSKKLLEGVERITDYFVIRHLGMPPKIYIYLLNYNAIHWPYNTNIAEMYFSILQYKYDFDKLQQEEMKKNQEETYQQSKELIRLRKQFNYYSEFIHATIVHEITHIINWNMVQRSPTLINLQQHDYSCFKFFDEGFVTREMDKFYNFIGNSDMKKLETWLEARNGLKAAYKEGKTLISYKNNWLGLYNSNTLKAYSVASAFIYFLENKFTREKVEKLYEESSKYDKSHKWENFIEYYFGIPFIDLLNEYEKALDLERPELLNLIDEIEALWIDPSSISNKIKECVRKTDINFLDSNGTYLHYIAKKIENLFKLREKFPSRSGYFEFKIKFLVDIIKELKLSQIDVNKRDSAGKHYLDHLSNKTTNFLREKAWMVLDINIVTNYKISHGLKTPPYHN